MIKIDIERVASIAKLKLTDKEKKMFEKELQDVLKAFKTLENAPEDTPCFHPLDLKNVTRKDVKTESFSQEKALSNTKHKENGFFKGPKAV